MKTEFWAARIYFLLGFVIYIFSGKYIDSLNWPSHYDPILELIPVIDLTIVSTYGLLFVYAAIAVFLRPLLNSEKERELLIMAGTLLIVRSVMCFSAGFGPPFGYFIPDNPYPFFYNWLPQHDFFFSGHTSAPFLCFLFFEGRAKKIFFLALTILMASAVLFLHHHYVIDVIAVPVVVWAVYSFFKFLIFRKKKKGGENEKDRGRYRSVRFYRDASGR